VPNEKERKKKAGQNKSKKMQAMREAVRDRHRRSATSRAGARRPTTDEKDTVTYKKGSAGDQTMRGTTKPGA
jgi:hypothetical protein